MSLSDYNANELLYVDVNDLTGRKIYYISDIHIEFKARKGFGGLTSYQYINHVITKINDGKSFNDSPLLIAGDISCRASDAEYFFYTLRMRTEGLIIFVLGNHEIWDEDEKNNRNLPYIIEKYRKICDKYDVILLHNEVAFIYDDMTGKGEILPFFQKKVILENELINIETEKLQEYSQKAKLIVYGGLGFSGCCKTIDPEGYIYNAELGLYRDVVPVLEEDIKESKRCEYNYLKVLEALKDLPVIVLTHSPLEHWTMCKHNSGFIYVSGHTHHDYLECTEEKTIFADNQVGYTSDSYGLKYFYIDGTYDTFKNYRDGIYKITRDQYIDFNVGKNIRIKKKDDGKQIYLIKKRDFYMFVYYNTQNKLVLLNGGSSKQLRYSIDYYYKNLERYGNTLKSIMDDYLKALRTISDGIKRIGGSGKIHGCIVDIDYYNHIYINPFDGKVIPYYAIDTKQKYVYRDIKTLIADKCPQLLTEFETYQKEKDNLFQMVPISSEIAKAAVLVTDRNMYKASRIIRNIQYLLFQNVIRDWNDKIISQYAVNKKEFFEEINKIHIDEKVLSKK